MIKKLLLGSALIVVPMVSAQAETSTSKQSVETVSSINSKSEMKLAGRHRFGGWRFGGHRFGGHRFGGHRFGGHRFGGHRFGGHRFGGHRFGGHRFGGHRFGVVKGS